MLMIELRHMSKVYANKRIGIWSIGNVNTPLHYKTMQQTKNAKDGDALRYFDPQLTKL